MGADPALLHEIRELEKRLADLRGRVVGRIEREQVPRSGPLPVVVCRLGDQRIALLQQWVSEVVMVCRLTPLPEAPAWIPGVLDCRGRSVLVLDVLARLKRQARRPELSDRIVLCEWAGRRVGLIVQELLGVESAAAEDLQAPPQDVECAPYVLGTLPVRREQALLFSLSALLDSSDVPGGLA
ncbi:MAG: chemotaxis protein CheW [Myxococcales bacterium]